MNTFPNRSDHAGDERGFALILTVFIIALATILVLDFANETLAYQRNSRAATERMQADYILKSTLNIAKLLLELPKLQITQDGQTKATREDWLGEPWAFVAGVPSLPLPGEPRLAIVDEAGKLNVNSIAAQGQSGNPNPIPNPPGDPSGGAGTGQNPNLDPASFWKNALSELFTRLGFQREVYASSQTRTLGDTGYAAEDEVAVINDWIDSDNDSHTSATFPGEGIESFADKSWFYNRPLRTFSELALVPGMTLDRLQAIGPFVRVGRSGFGSSGRVNVNTAPLEVLLALGFPESQVVEIDGARSGAPITAGDLQQLVAGDIQLSQATTVSSQEFSAYAQVRAANSTRWAKALITVQGGTTSRRAVITALELN